MSKHRLVIGEKRKGQGRAWTLIGAPRDLDKGPGRAWTLIGTPRDLDNGTRTEVSIWSDTCGYHAFELKHWLSLPLLDEVEVMPGTEYRHSPYGPLYRVDSPQGSGSWWTTYVCEGGTPELGWDSEAAIIRAIKQERRGWPNEPVPETIPEKLRRLADELEAE